ncbi:DNA methyltransferase [Rhizobium ruizarguesonis]
MDGANNIAEGREFGTGMRQASMRRLAELDWDFPTQTSESAFSSLHWHPCRFPSQIPAISIARLTEKGDVVLDPFMGSATTIVEAQRLGRRAIGIDTNPVSVLMAKAKSLSQSGEEVGRYFRSLQIRLRHSWPELSEAPIPETVQASKWYSPSTLQGLRKLWGLVSADDGELGIIGKAAFSSILLPSCRETRHWGYVCDNSQPKSDREVDVATTFEAAMNRFLQAYQQRDKESLGPTVEAAIFGGSSDAVLDAFPDDSVQCVVSSPPYFGVADYVKAQRLSMEWMSWPIEPVRQQEIGARSKRHRLTSLEDYISDLRKVFTQVRRVMKINGMAVIVFGQSPARRESYDRFVEMLKDIGFSIELERRRQIPRARRQMPSLLDEIVLVCTKR